VIVASDPKTGYIVTAKHVFDDPTKQWHPRELRLRFAWQERRSVYEYLGVSVALVDSAQKQLWLAANGQDIAAIPLDTSKMELTEGTQPHAIFLTDIATQSDMFEGANIMVLGFPGIVGNEYLVRAITRAGIIAWLNPDDPYGKPFLIDANIYPGNSGGPVLRVPTGVSKTGSFAVGGKPTLLGIVSQAPSATQELTLTVPGSPLPLQLKQSLPLGGTGVIEPALKIPDLLKRLGSQ
jgi:V8-like Glu-specific endopeptidase